MRWRRAGRRRRRRPRARTRRRADIANEAAGIQRRRRRQERAGEATAAHLSGRPLKYADQVNSMVQFLRSRDVRTRWTMNLTAFRDYPEQPF